MIVLLDALGTLVELQPPAPRLRGLLAERGFHVDEERAAAGFQAEIGYYLGHHLEGSSRERPARPDTQRFGVMRSSASSRTAR